MNPTVKRCEWCGDICDTLCKVVHPWRKYHHSGPVLEEKWAVCPHCEADLKTHLMETLEHGFASVATYAIYGCLFTFGPAIAIYGLFLVLGLGAFHYAGVGLPLALGFTGLLCWKSLYPHPIWISMFKPCRALGTPFRDAVAIARGFALVAGIGFPLVALLLIVLARVVP